MTSVWQAGCVAIGQRGMLIEGAPRSGKSSLALALIDRGAELVGDDGVTLWVENTALWAAPPPHTAGLIEVRNVGLIPVPVRDRVHVALVITLDSFAPRFVDQPEWTERGGVKLPLIRLWPDSPVLALRAEAALNRYGLPTDGLHRG